MERVEKLKKFLQENPDDCFIRHALGLEYIKLGDDAEAREYFEGIIRLNPDYVGTYYHLAKLYERTNDPEKAKSTYEKGMEVARMKDEHHAYGELKSAFEEFMM